MSEINSAIISHEETESSNNDDEITTSIETNIQLISDSSSNNMSREESLTNKNSDGDNNVTLPEFEDISTESLTESFGFSDYENSVKCSKENEKGSTSSDIQPERTMEGSTELLHHHQFPPPTFSRLPPDGDEFPNSCWSDEQQQQFQQVGKKFFRSQYSVESSKSSDPGSPPPLPTTEPPIEDTTEPPLPATVPPVIPPKKMATRRCSFDERKKLFENGSTDPMLPTKPGEEPSKKSVRDKIAMFSNRSSSEESNNDAISPSIFPKQISNHITSSLSKSTINISNSSKSSDNLLEGKSSGRKGSIDLSSCPANSIAGNKPPGYATLTRQIPNGTSSVTGSLYERSQSMIDVAAGNGTSNTIGRPVSTMMENRRKCMTKLRGLVIPDDTKTANMAGNGTKTCASVADLPTIISKDAIILPQQTGHTSKPPLYSTLQNNNNNNESPLKKSISRTESLDRFASMDKFSRNDYNTSAKANNAGDLQSEVPLNFANVMPKYSPAFKRRGLSTYQTSMSTSSLLPSKTTPVNIANKYKVGIINQENSLLSPRSDSSSFEFSSPSPDKQLQHGKAESEELKNKSCEKPVQVTVEKEASKAQLLGKVGSTKTNGKLEDSDNDSAVSSSRSSISHGLSPPNSPTPGESSAATPDPDNSDGGKQGAEESMNMDESWRVLKPTSIEAINRKNVLKSSKFSSGVGSNGNGTDDSSLSSSSNGKNRRSDDEEASYADVETEDTESSCSELEGSGVKNNHGRRNSKVEPEYDEEEMTQQSAVHMEFTQLTESPLQAILDMEVKMAYINEVCDALNDRGRYFSRRDSEATVIERPIEPKRKGSFDTVDHNTSSSSADRRARNRSSSGNESDFSSNVSIGSQPNSHRALSREASNNEVDSGRWNLLEKKYSKSMTSVNNLGGAKPELPQTTPQTLTPAASVPKIITSASEVVEKKIEKIIEKSSAETIPNNKKTQPNIPRGRNDFKSIASKWQQIEKSTDSNSTQAKPVILEKPVLCQQNSASSIQTSTPNRSKLSSVSATSSSTSSSSSSPSPSTKSFANILESKSSENLIRTALLPSSKEMEVSTKAKLEAMEADRAWAEKRRSEGETKRNVNSKSGSTKRSVSVSDIRKAFEKAEIAVNSYGREDNNSTEASSNNSGKKGDGGLSLPAAHFRVSSFDSTTSEESSATTPGIYGSSNSLVSSVQKDPYGSITSLASSTSLISPQELQQLIDEANQSLEEAGTPSHFVSVVILHREFAGGSLGITLAGGADYETKEITVHKVLNASIADRDGRIHRGDRILSINGKSTKGLTHREALNLLKTPRTEVVLVISRGRSASNNGFQTIEETSALDRAIEPLLNPNLVIENDDDTCYKWGPLKTATLVKDGAGLGFSLEGGKGSIQGDKPLTVKKIFIGGPAEKSGELKVGDLIVSIYGVNMSTKSRTEAWNFMKKLSDGEVKISIRSPLA